MVVICAESETDGSTKVHPNGHARKQSATPSSVFPAPEEKRASTSSEGKSKTSSSTDRSTFNKLQRASNAFQVKMSNFQRQFTTEDLASLDKETQFFAGITTMHGPLRVYQSNRRSRIFWALAMILCWALLIVQCVMLVNDYVKHPAMSQILIQVTDEGLVVPTVTVCNLNPVRRSYIQSLNATGELSEQLLHYLGAYLRVPVTPDPAFQLTKTSNLSQLIAGDNALEAYMSRHNFSAKEFYRQAGFTCTDIFKQCSFAGQIFDCCTNVVEQMMPLGKCFTVSIPGKGGVQLLQGVEGGLQLILDPNLDELLGAQPDDPIVSFGENQLNDGFRYFLHSPNSTPYAAAVSGTVSPGFHAYSAIEARQIDLRSMQSYGACLEDWPDQIGLTLRVERQYEPSTCQDVCKAENVKNQCGCYPLAYVLNDGPNIDPDVCRPYQLYNCTVALGMANADFDQGCSKCSAQCESWQYSAFNSYGSGFSKGAVRWMRSMNDSWTEEIIRNFAVIDVFHRELAFMSYSQVTTTSITQLLSSIGGNMGLFLGMSVLTVVEALMFISKITWIVASKKRREHMLRKKRADEERERRLEVTLERAVGERKVGAVATAAEFCRALQDSMLHGAGRAEIGSFMESSLGTKRRRTSSVSDMA